MNDLTTQPVHSTTIFMARYMSRFMARFFTTFSVVLSALFGAPASASGPVSPAFDAAFASFQQARTGDTQAIDRAADAFTTLHQAEPVNPVLMAYAGSATTMRANTTWLPWKKMTFAEDGMAMLDKALAMLTAEHNAPQHLNVPAALEVRFIAANTFLAVPGFMNRGARGAKLMQAVLSSPLLASSPPEFRADVWLMAANLAVKDKRVADARGLLEQVVKLNGPQAAAARAQLQGLPA